MESGSCGGVIHFTCFSFRDILVWQVERFVLYWFTFAPCIRPDSQRRVGYRGIIKMTDEQGWVKIHRKSLASSVWGDPVTWMVWCWCLMRANRANADFPFNGKDVHLRRGQFITGRRSATAELPISESQYRTRLDYLKSTNRIRVHITNKFSIITIVNYGYYQDDIRKTANRIAYKSPTNRQQIATNNKDKNDKKKGGLGREEELNTEEKMRELRSIGEILKI